MARPTPARRCNRRDRDGFPARRTDDCWPGVGA